MVLWGGARGLACPNPGCGVGFGDYGDTHVRFALIENEHRIRQAVRGIKEMFRKDGLLAPRATERAVA